METQNTQEKSTVYGVYSGEYNSGGHRYFFFENLEVNNGESVNTSKGVKGGIFKSKLGSTEIGGVYEFGRTGNTYSFAKKPVTLGWWKNSEDKLEWRTRTRAYQDSKKKLKDDKTLRGVVEPLRQIYLRSDYSQKTLILAEVIRLITGER